jgi:hypothetical protein
MANSFFVGLILGVLVVSTVAELQFEIFADYNNGKH